jgi:Sulfatase-modifying factor enzyme 1
MSEPEANVPRSVWWRRALAGVAQALDLLPDGLAITLGLGLGAALVVAAAVGGWLWLSGVGVGLALVLGRSAGVRPRPAGWAWPAAGTAVLLGLGAGMLGFAVMGVGEGEPSVVVLADDADLMRLDLGDGGTTGSTGGTEDTAATTTGEASSSTGTVASTSSGGDETTGAPPPPKPRQPPRRVVEPPSDDTTGGSDDTTGGNETTTEGDAPTEPIVVASCPSGMKFIDGGSFDGHDIEPFCLDTTEVRVSSYERCMADGKCSEAGTEYGVDGEYSEGGYCNRNHDDRGSQPINCVDWNQAKAFCAWAGKRLPTQWEWEWAARGRDEGRTYPWGEEEPTCARAVMSKGGDGCGKDRTWNVGSMSKGHSRDGVKDMAGNVWEWTSSKEGEVRIVRGGSWISYDPVFFRASYRFSFHPTYRSIYVGMRCARTAGGSK